MSDKDKNDIKIQVKREKKPKIPKEELVETKHSAIISDKSVSYTVNVGTMLIKEEEEEKEPQAKATIFYIAYIRDDIENKESRPITFSFNGGPGSSSVWLHLGVLGPRRVIAEENDNPVPPPYRLVNNEYSLLDVTDLVFIDPVSTGYSRAVPGEKNTQFHEYKKDINTIGEFIRLYTSRIKRWNSPKFLIGESYGTTRAAGLAGYLHEDLGMFLNGIMLISCILNFQTGRFNPGNDLPNILFLPTYSATAWYHKKLPEELQADLHQTLKEVTAFAMNDYTLALMKGDQLSSDEEAQIITQLVRYTGLSEKYVRGANLRINIHKFVKELLREEHRTVGRLDSRFKGIDRDDTGAEVEFDPSYAVIQGPYTATLNDYVRRDLNFASDLPYEILAPIYKTWKYEDYDNQYLNVGETLRQAMSMNPFLKVFVGNGYYDLATPFFATEYTFSHLELDPSLRKNISMGFYEAGHMMYLHPPSLAKLRDDLVNFIQSALPLTDISE
ncbi:MAG: peptidase S10 [Candidatus Heimdallarchaeota archaeon]|nr:MAG: peptidase S10 [Candidatus Heimdallarchaeota archaeon]